MNEYKMDMNFTCVTSDADHFYNTVLMIAKGFKIGVLKSKLGPIEPEIVSSNTEEPIPEEVSILKKNLKKNLSLKEAAEYLNVSTSTLYKYTSTAKIPFYKLGSRTLFNIEELDYWMKKHKAD